jgi:predicted permease
VWQIEDARRAGGNDPVGAWLLARWDLARNAVGVRFDSARNTLFRTDDRFWARATAGGGTSQRRGPQRTKMDENMSTLPSGFHTFVGNLRHDLSFAFRMLLKNPMFTAAAVITLALGIGLNAAVFSAVNAMLFRPLPEVKNDSELVHLYRDWPGMPWGSNSIPHYQDIRDRVDAFDGQVLAWTFAPVSLSTDGINERIMANMVSANYFDVLGAPPILGRGFLPGEALDPGAHRVIVLGHSFWQTRFGADPSVVGRTVTLNGQSWMVVGVAKEEFKGTMPMVDPPMFAPLMMQRELIPGYDLIEARGNNWMNVVARRAPGMSVEQCRQQLDATTLQLREDYPDHYDNNGIYMVPQTEAGLHPMIRSAQVGMSALTMVVVAFLLMIACINVANLFLARAGERRKEMGIRLSLGAKRSRIITQLLTESLLFAVIACGAGLLLAYWAVGAANSLSLPMDIPIAFDLSLDRNVLLFAVGISVLTGILFGLAPALQASRPDTVTSLKGEASREPGGKHRLVRTLVVVQTALSIVLLISSGLFLRGLQSATTVDKGFDENNLLLASVDPGLQGYDRERSEVFYRELEAGLSTLPGVEAVGFARMVPLTLNSSDRGVGIPGYEPAENESMSIRYNMVTPGYFDAMGIPLLAGRPFFDMDDRDGARVMIVNQQFVNRFWPGEDAVGRTLRTGGEEWEIVGVVPTGKYFSLGEEPSAFMYFPQAQEWNYSMTAHLRTTGDPNELAASVRREVQRLDASMPVADLRTMTNTLGVSLFPARLGGAALGIFGILGMILAAVGIYSVMAYSVSQRKHEIGIRVALGAASGSVVGMVMKKGMTTVGLGVVLGAGIAMGTSRLMENLIYGVSAIDPLTFLGVPGMLCAVALLATYLPARRAASVDPMRALRSE